MLEKYPKLLFFIIYYKLFNLCKADFHLTFRDVMCYLP